MKQWDPQSYARRSSKASGCRIAEFDGVLTPIPKHEAEWLAMVAAPFLFASPGGRRDAILAEVYEALDSMLRAREGTWVADYVRLRFAACKPA